MPGIQRRRLIVISALEKFLRLANCGGGALLASATAADRKLITPLDLARELHCLGDGAVAVRDAQFQNLAFEHAL